MKENTIIARVYYQDTDAGGVIYHSRYLDFCERARTEWLRGCGAEQTELAEKQNILFVVRSLYIEYISAGKLDDLLEITTKIKYVKGVRIFMEQNIFRKNKNSKTLLAQINLELVSTNRDFQPVRLSEELKDKLFK